MMRNYFISISKSSEDKIDVQHLNIDHAYYLSVSDIFLVLTCTRETFYALKKVEIIFSIVNFK